MGVILLATDGGEYARRAAERAIDLAEERGEPLHVICVVVRRRFDDPALGSAELATIYAEDHAAVCVDGVVGMAEDRNVVVRGDTRHGIPHEVVLEYAEEVDADVVVLGGHGDRGEHFRGVGRRIAGLTDRDVEVVEAGAQ